MRAAKLLVLVGFCCCVCFLSGCAGTFWGHAVEFLRPEGDPKDSDIYERYKQTKLKESSAADVLAAIHMPEFELLSQSKSVVASSGQKKKGYKRWFNMVAFDENELAATRKYLFMLDERPKVLFVEPWTGLRFDCEVVLGAEVLDKPYADENARRIVILRQVLESFGKDTDEVGPDNKVIATSGMMINQALETVLVKLGSSPALASRLSEPAGVEFDHVSLHKGRIRMLIEDNVVTVKMRLGSQVKTFKD